jgi:GT2 family glycosyltransferase
MTDAVYAYYNDDPHQAHFFTTNNLALPAERFRAIGGFDTTFPLAASEDREFCDRWLHHGYQMTYSPEVVVYHAHVLTLRTFWGSISSMVAVLFTSTKCEYTATGDASKRILNSIAICLVIPFHRYTVAERYCSRRCWCCRTQHLRQGFGGRGSIEPLGGQQAGGNGRDDPPQPPHLPDRSDARA